jgi:hypothetical protein
MNDELKKRADEFEKEYQDAMKLRKEKLKIFKDAYVKIYVDLKPIIDVMKKYQAYFQHPDLSQDIKTVHGPIIGSNLKDGEIYVLNDDFLVFTVNVLNDVIQDKNLMNFSVFITRCNIEFAWNGLNWLYSSLHEVIEHEKNKIDKIESTIAYMERA